LHDVPDLELRCAVAAADTARSSGEPLKQSRTTSTMRWRDIFLK
jgi:hypothetical protein